MNLALAPTAPDVTSLFATSDLSCGQSSVSSVPERVTAWACETYRSSSCTELGNLTNMACMFEESLNSVKKKRGLIGMVEQCVPSVNCLCRGGAGFGVPGESTGVKICYG